MKSKTNYLHPYFGCEIYSVAQNALRLCTILIQISKNLDPCLREGMKLN